MTAIAKQGTPTPSTKLVDGHNRFGTGWICGEDIAAGDAVTLALNSTANTAGVPVMQAMLARGSADNQGAIVVGFAAQAAKAAQSDAVTILRDIDFRYGSGFVGSFMANGTVFVYLSTTVPGGLDTVPPWLGAQPIGVIVDDSRIRLFGNYGYANLGVTPTLEPAVRHDEFVLAATAGNGGSLAFQNTEGSPIIIPVGGCIADVQTVASGACTLSVGSAVNGTTSATNLLNAVDAHAAVALFSNATPLKVAAGNWITATLSAPTAFVGRLSLDYRVVSA